MSRSLGILPIYKLVPDPKNLRGRLVDLEDLAASMASVGVLQPLLVTPLPDGIRYRIIAGHRRHAAAGIAGIDKLPVVVVDKVAPGTDTAMMLVENSQRADLQPIEEARGLHALAGKLPGVSTADLARVVGRSRGWVEGRLALLDLPDDAQRMVADGRLSTGEATALARQVRRSGRGQVARDRCPQTFTRYHPLADSARRRCDGSQHPQPGRVGSIACSRCWEDTIRADVRRALQPAA